jgi:hypothetical protein
MKCWSEFAAEQPAMAEAGRALLYQFRVGLGYLATVQKDGGPRVHPVCPVIAHDGLYVFMGNHSPKVHDLLRDGCFALHAFPHPEVDDEFYVAGRARRIDDARVRQIVYEAYTAMGAFTRKDTLFERLDLQAFGYIAKEHTWPSMRRRDRRSQPCRDPHRLARRSSGLAPSALCATFIRRCEDEGNRHA